MKILITGAAGFIGYFLVKYLLQKGEEVVGLDNINDYYDVNLKFARLNKSGIAKKKIDYNKITESSKYPNYKFIKLELVDRENLSKLFMEEKFDIVCNLAAQVGVRYSLENPNVYLESNFIGFFNIIDQCRIYDIKNFVYASSSSVYGLNRKMPFSEKHNVDHPLNLYAASKKSNESIAHTYSYLYDIAATGLRFFTVYGPWGRPDMAYFKFANQIMKGEPIDIYNNGEMMRDFTYIDDIIEGIVRVIYSPAQANVSWDGNNPEPSSSTARYKIYNIGNNNPVRLLDFIKELENALGIRAKKNFLPMQPGEVPVTWADSGNLMKELGYRPDTPLCVGIRKFIEWYQEFYGFKLQKH